MKLTDLPEHHAVLIVNHDRQVVGESLWKELQEKSLVHRFFDQTVLDIDTVRSLIAWAQTAYNGQKTALVSFHTAGIPAQNAMLKILEEPRDGVRFILVTSNVSALIPTVLSRVHQIRSQKSEDREERVEGTKEVHLFLETKPTLRMKLPFVVELVSREDEEGRKDREAVRAFILDLVDVLRATQYIKPAHIQETLEMASYAGDPSSSGKALLEYLSLLLPEMKQS